MTIVEKAREFAKARHEGQYRRGECKCGSGNLGLIKLSCPICHGTGKVPYFTHCEKVASLVEDDIEKAVAYLHDLIEDNKATAGDILSVVEDGTNVGLIILTNLEHLTHDINFLNYFDYIYSIKGCSREVIHVKIADIVSNLSDSPTQKQIEKYNKALRILAGV